MLIHTVGKNVKIWGTVAQIDPSSPTKWFALNGSTGVTVKCELADGVTVDPNSTMVAVTGVATFEVVNGQTQDELLVRSQDDIQPLIGTASISGSVTQGGNQTIDQVVESPHNYPNNYNNIWTITGPAGTTQIRVHFTQIQTESCCDSLNVKDGSGAIQQTYKGTYSDVWSNWVMGNTINLNLTSDGSVTDYGFQVDHYQVQLPGTPVPGVALMLTPGDMVTQSLADGSYSFGRLNAGMYTITPSLSGATFTPAFAQVTLSDGQPIAGVNFGKN